MEPARVVIVGAGLSGLRTAEKLRRLGHQGAITLLGEEAHLPYDRPPLSKSLLVQDDEPTPVSLRKPERYDELDLDLRIGTSATGLDIAARQVTLDDGSSVPYDHLVIATGTRARAVPAWSALAGVHTLRTFDDCLALRDGLRAARHVTVVGAGVLGSEIASSARTLGLEVDLVEPLSQPLVRVLGEQVGAAVADLHRSHGVTLHLGLGVDRISGSDRVTAVHLTDGTTIDTDLVVVAIGGVVDTAWLEGSGLELADGVVCDATGASSAPGVWAVGDVARMPQARGTGSVRLEHWTAAGDTAARVAANIVDPDPAPLTEAPYFWSDQHGAKIQCLGLPAPEDDLTVVAGSLADGSFLAICSSDGHVQAAVAISMPAPLARCRNAVTTRMPLDELLEQAPWDRKKATA